MSPSGYGLCSFLARELGDLWDVPIRFLDSLLDLEVMGLMADICKSPPSKLLHTEADLLLTSAFQGGLEGREAQEGGRAGPVPGPCPCSDAGFGPTPAYERKHPPETELTMEEFAVEEEVIKGDLQKADNAAVPDNLWLRAFVLGYGNLGCLGCHLGALGRTEGTAGFLGGPMPPMGWQGALPGLCCFALRYWCSRVTRGFITWCGANIPLPAAPSGEGQLVCYHWEWQQGVGHPVYEWSATGRQRYQTKWRLTRASADGKATVEAGHDVIHCCTDATWFEWPKGLAPLFWNWGPEYQKEVRDGQPHFMTGTLIMPFMRKQAKARDPLKQELMRA